MKLLYSNEKIVNVYYENEKLPDVIKHCSVYYDEEHNLFIFDSSEMPRVTLVPRERVKKIKVIAHED